MKKIACLTLILSLLTLTPKLHAQNQPRAAQAGSSSGLTGSAVAIGLTVVVAVVAIAIASNSSGNGHS